MAIDSSTGRSSGGSVSLVTLVSGTYAYVTTPSFTGIKGVFASAMTGMGTSLVCGLYALGGAAAGFVVGAAAGAAGGKLEEGAAVGAIIFAIGGGVYGIYDGYGYAKDITVNGMGTDKVSEVTVKPANDNILLGQGDVLYDSCENTIYIRPADDGTGNPGPSF